MKEGDGKKPGSTGMGIHIDAHRIERLRQIAAQRMIKEKRFVSLCSLLREAIDHTFGMEA